MNKIPSTQNAVQLIGPDELILNTAKAVHQPNDHQILCKVIVVGLCFSDLKLLKQFSGHVRKSEVLNGINPQVLKENPAYVPGELPTVPGHEPVVMLTALDYELNKELAGDLGADGYLTKPVSRQKLLDVIQRFSSTS